MFMKGVMRLVSVWKWVCRGKKQVRDLGGGVGKSRSSLGLREKGVQVLAEFLFQCLEGWRHHSFIPNQRRGGEGACSDHRALKFGAEGQHLAGPKTQPKPWAR